MAMSLKAFTTCNNHETAMVTYMIIRELSADDCGGGSEIIRKQLPTWEDVERAVRRLDGTRFTQVNLADGEDTGLLISGGHGGRYACERMQHDDNYLLLDPTLADDPPLKISDDADYPGSWTVELEMALKAARVFFETGQLDPSMQWRGP
jgi:Immunity protein Imm1